jgi:mannose-1-phosphate guanylyltransferase/mannose-6-phosphate isomerase
MGSDTLPPSPAPATPRVHAVVLAGGSGVRFWPLSRELSPKQFLSIFGGESLIAGAVARGRAVPGCVAVHLVTGERLLPELRNHLSPRSDIGGDRIDYIVEPAARNTAAAIALAAAVIAEADPDGLLVVLPADHLLSAGPEWDRALAASLGAAAGGRLVTIGLEPTRPETGYGYIKAGAAVSAEVREVECFVEKPDSALAKRFLAEGGYLWNSGMLVAPASLVLSELEAAGERAATPESAGGRAIADAARAVAALPADGRSSDVGRALFTDVPSVPFDKAVLEVSERVVVVPTTTEWSDVGSLLAIADLAEPDERGNVLVGRVTDVDSSGVIAYSADRLLATLGLHDVIVVDTPDATLVADKSRTQDVRLVVEALRLTGARELIEPRTSLRPWGSWTLLLKSGAFQVKTIRVEPGKRLSLQRHAHRSEHWIVVTGTAEVEVDGTSMTIEAGRSAYVPAGSVHRLGCVGDATLEIVEVAVGDYLGEDDIERLHDDWAR